MSDGWSPFRKLSDAEQSALVARGKMGCAACKGTIQPGSRIVRYIPPDHRVAAFRGAMESPEAFRHLTCPT